MIIGITGYIGSGKTTVAKIFESHGYNIMDVDHIGHELLKRGDIKNQVTSIFGTDILDRKMDIDRKLLREIVFKYEDKLKKLNDIVHPEIKRVVREVLEKFKENIIIDAALLAELGFIDFCDKTIIVKADIKDIYERKSPDYTKNQILDIMSNQHMPEEADYIIENNGTYEELKTKVEEIFNDISKS